MWTVFGNHRGTGGQKPWPADFGMRTESGVPIPADTTPSNDRVVYAISQDGKALAVSRLESPGHR